MKASTPIVSTPIVTGTGDAVDTQLVSSDHDTNITSSSSPAVCVEPVRPLVILRPRMKRNLSTSAICTSSTAWPKRARSNPASGAWAWYHGRMDLPEPAEEAISHRVWSERVHTLLTQEVHATSTMKDATESAQETTQRALNTEGGRRGFIRRNVVGRIAPHAITETSLNNMLERKSADIMGHKNALEELAWAVTSRPPLTHIAAEPSSYYYLEDS